MRKWILGMVAVMGVVLMAACGGGSSPSTANTTPSPAAKATATAKPDVAKTPAPKPTAVPMSASDNGVNVVVSGVQYDVPSGNDFITPEAGNVFVTLNVTITNTGSSEYNANPVTFVLKDGAGIKHTVAFMDPNSMWSAVNLTKGATITKPLAFQATAGKPTGLVLVWTPNFLSGDHNIKLS